MLLATCNPHVERVYFDVIDLKNENRVIHEGRQSHVQLRESRFNQNRKLNAEIQCLGDA
jgi:hypothetical protein